MQFKKPKNDEKIVWTIHIIEKMMYYGLSENKVRNVMWRPERVEEGIAPDTIAIMQSYGSSKKPKEIWVMFQEFKQMGKKKRRMISAWRYPAVSPKGKEIYIPDDVMEMLNKIRTISRSAR
ncbi:MAG: hypothetical protein D4S01_00255 [Dehalococcoidia bacterium]|nr:MAG: hypothetical protein D4S01_00255 [Dehalococcoidia bacterium]